jgi:hypothetical protein
MNLRTYRHSILFITCGFGAVLGCDAQKEPSYQGEALASLRGHVEATSDVQSADIGLMWFTTGPAGSCSGPTSSCTSAAGFSVDPVTVGCLDVCGKMPDCTEPDALEAYSGCMDECGAEFQLITQTRWGLCASGGIAQTVPVVGGFPANFELDVLTPPPEDALVEDSAGYRAALAYFVALKPGTAPVAIVRDSEEPPAWLLGGSETHMLLYLPAEIPESSPWGQFLGGSLGQGFHLMQVKLGVRCGLPESVSSEGSESGNSQGSGESSGGGDGGGADGTESSAGASPTEQDLSGVELVCGNGVCEEPETCDFCSDCACTDGGGLGESTGETNLGGHYSCMSTPPTLRPAPKGMDSDVQLIIAPADAIDWPNFL